MKTLLFLTGESGSGKGWTYEHIIKPEGRFYKLVAATTRKIRDGEVDGTDYYFRDEKFFDSNKFATYLFPNKPEFMAAQAAGQTIPRWLYGVPESELEMLIGQNLVYDVIEPRYVLQLMNWFVERDLHFEYDFSIAWFQKQADNQSLILNRKNMQDDLSVRTRNTCSSADFKKLSFTPHWNVWSSAASGVRIADACGREISARHWLNQMQR